MICFNKCKQFILLKYKLKIRNKFYFLQEPNTISVAWNNQYEDMLAYSGNNVLAIKVESFPAYKQKLTGFVVGQSGSKTFCLNGSLMSTLELPLSAPMYQYIEKKMFVQAHKVACLGMLFKMYIK